MRFRETPTPKARIPLVCGMLMCCLAIPAGAQDEPAPKKPLMERLKEFGKDKLLKEPFTGDDPEALKGMAATIRAEELDVDNRVRAVEYLGTVDCVAYPEARDKLVETLEKDKYEEVRFAAAEALQVMLSRGRTEKERKLFKKNKGSDRYDTCPGCCTAEVLNRLTKVARGRDERNCAVEPSKRVRDATMVAIKACGNCCRRAPVPYAPGPEMGPPPAAIPGTGTGRGQDDTGGGRNREVRPGQGGEQKPNGDGNPPPAPGKLSQSPVPVVPISRSRDAQNPRPLAALNGYCVVALKSRQFRPGTPQFQSFYKGTVYYFADAAAKRLFDNAPEKFSIAFGGMDPVIRAVTGQQVAGQYLREYEGRFYLFVSKENWEEFKKDTSSFVTRSSI